MQVKFCYKYNLCVIAVFRIRISVAKPSTEKRQKMRKKACTLDVGLTHTMALPLMEFQVQGYKIRNIFA